jgi:phage-related protein
MVLTDTPLEFVGSSRDDLSNFPDDVKRCIGLALRTAQKGGKHPDAKPLKGFKGAGVLEIISDFDGNTFRRYTPSDCAASFMCSTPFKRNLARESRHP